MAITGENLTGNVTVTGARTDALYGTGDTTLTVPSDATSSSSGNSIIAPGTNFTFGGGVTGDCVEVTLSTKVKGVTRNAGNNKLEGLLAQQISGTISKQPRTVYEIGSDQYYVFEAKPQGTGSIAHFIGPNKSDLWQTLKDFAGVCNETELTMGVKNGCTCTRDGGTLDNVSGSLKFTGGFLNTIQVSAVASDYVLTSNLGFTFFDLQNV